MPPRGPLRACLESACSGAKEAPGVVNVSREWITPTDGAPRGARRRTRDAAAHGDQPLGPSRAGSEYVGEARDKSRCARAAGLPPCPPPCPGTWHASHRGVKVKESEGGAVPVSACSGPWGPATGLVHVGCWTRRLEDATDPSASSSIGTLVVSTEIASVSTASIGVTDLNAASRLGLATDPAACHPPSAQESLPHEKRVHVQSRCVVEEQQDRRVSPGKKWAGAAFLSLTYTPAVAAIETLCATPRHLDATLCGSGFRLLEMDSVAGGAHTPTRARAHTRTRVKEKNEKGEKEQGSGFIFVMALSSSGRDDRQIWMRVSQVSRARGLHGQEAPGCVPQERERGHEMPRQCMNLRPSPPPGCGGQRIGTMEGTGTTSLVQSPTHV
ncbi:hypothetical protein Purlil1_4877 [Purpureocillium lilacinum]|uniref:Uncharacterized protein n=1 Tax=Purpureocillium lilacinum TaxID=33203 RepID=A0ABR0C3R7_PURLI|nr:hypothetical protein Purlil1_4877 [Purpureocillium lilacinum]